MTNDGRVTDKLLSPRFLHEKEYLVTTDRPFNDFFLQSMANGIRIDGSVTRKAKVERNSPNSFFIILTEGKKRQIRRMCEAMHIDVVDLQRIRIMNILLGKLAHGEYRHLTPAEKKTLLQSLYIPEKDTLTMAIMPVKVVKPKVEKVTPTVVKNKKSNNLRATKSARPMKSAPRRKSR
jgi:hypothetical protein